PGTYNVTRGLLLNGGKANITILAYGARLNFSGSSGNALTISGISNLNIFGLTLNGNTSSPGTGTGIYLTNSTRTTLRDCKIWNIGDENLRAVDSWWLSTQNCEFWSAGLACVYHDSNSNAITHTSSRFAASAVNVGSGNPSNANAQGTLV